MLYVKTKNINGKITFSPIKEDSVYILCKRCGRFVPVPDPSELIQRLLRSLHQSRILIYAMIVLMCCVSIK